MVKKTELTLGSSAAYRICVCGDLNEELSVYLQEMEVTHPPGDEEKKLTFLTGRIIDQAALLGVLNALYNMAMPLVSVELLEEPVAVKQFDKENMS